MRAWLRDAILRWAVWHAKRLEKKSPEEAEIFTRNVLLGMAGLPPDKSWPVSIEKAASGQPFVIKDMRGNVLHHRIADIHAAYGIVEKRGYRVTHVVDPDVQAY